jgi:hypothetical protein
VPSEKGVRGHDAVDLVQRRPAERFGREETALLVSEADSPSPVLQLLSEEPVLVQDILQSPVLLPVEPAGYREHQHEPRVDDRCRRLFVTVESRWSMLKNQEQK